MSGQAYSGELMVVGRAVNGWFDEIAPSELGDEARRRQYAEQVHQSVTKKTDGACPMCWITDYWGAAKGYNTKRSAFWQGIRAVVAGLNIADVNDRVKPWPSHLLWSNLYKVSPADGGNPPAELCRVQFDGCLKLLRWELEHYKPRRILFLTGRDWADPFLDWIDRRQPDGCFFVEGAGRVRCTSNHTAVCVIAKHPQGKNRTKWTNEVVSAFT